MLDKNELIESLVKNKDIKLKLKNEYVFRKIFSDPKNSDALKDLVEAILNEKIEKVEVLNPEMPEDILDSEMGTLFIDTHMADGTNINVILSLKDIIDSI